MNRRTVALSLCACLAAAVVLGAEKVREVQWTSAKSMSELTDLKTVAGERKGQVQTVEFKFDLKDVDVSNVPEGATVKINGCQVRPSGPQGGLAVPRKAVVVTLPKGAKVNGVEVSQGEYVELVGAYHAQRAATMSVKSVVAPQPTAEEIASFNQTAASAAGTDAAGKRARDAKTAAPEAKEKPADLAPEKMIEYNTWPSREGQRVWVGVYPVRVDRRVDKLVLFSRLRVQIYYDVE